MFHFGDQKQSLSLPEAKGQTVTLQEKIFVPVKEHPDVSVCERVYGAGNHSVMNVLRKHHVI